MRVLLVGAGALGSSIAKGLVKMPRVRLAIFDVDLKRGRALAHETGALAPDDLDLAIQEADLVIEAAAQEALKVLAPRVLGRGLPLIALSVGALADEAFLETCTRLATEHGTHLYVPSGAIGALDVIRAAGEDDLYEVTLVTAKPPAGFGLTDVKEARVLYEGPAREAVKLYPKNVNVAAALSLAGLGFEKTRVKIIADPTLTANTHTIVAKGAFGELTCRVENRPSPANPASSHLASLAVLALVRRLLAPVTVGT